MDMDALRATGDRVPDVLATVVAREGSATHGWPAALASTGQPRDLADAVHQLMALHGRHPGIFDDAAVRTTGLAAAWLADAADEFTGERAHLNRLAVAAGPLPSTPGHAESEAALVGQRHALDMLARSDRAGCALGAALALALDWEAVRGVLDAAAIRFGVPIVRPILPAAPALAVALDTSLTQAAARAVRFGARQLLLQHRGLWDLLESRAVARRTA